MTRPLTVKELASLKAKPRKALTVKVIDGLRPAPAGMRYEIMDPAAPGLGVRVTDKGKRTFVLVGRFPGGKHPTRREIAEVGVLTLEAARQKARDWVALIKKGIDPRVEQERQRQTELRKQRHTLSAVAEEYLKRHVAKQRTAKKTERAIRVELLPTLGARPIIEVTREEVKDLLRAIIDRPAPRMAELVYQHIRGIFAWAGNEGTYGLEAAPTDKINPKLFFGERKPRTRVLSDDELRAFWRASERIGYPFGAVFQLLLLTGCREAEIGSASWREISPDGTLLRVPAARFKSEVEHLVPLSDDARAVLETLPRFTRGDFIFTTTHGEKPVSNYGKAKDRLDRCMAEELGYAPEHFRVHDLRRTLRTRLSSLRVPFEIAEMVIGHSRRGVWGTYDKHEYLDEMSEALTAWSSRLRSIIDPPPANVVQFDGRASA
ncbi:MAG: tyrosine-type recombinase/integrase [Methyloceanibacter sp.]